VTLAVVRALAMGLSLLTATAHAVVLGGGNERLARHFEASGVEVIRGADNLRRHSERYGARLWGKYKNYLSEEGHKTLAELLVARIRNVLPAGAPPRRN